MVPKSRVTPDQPDIRLIQQATGNGRSITFNLYYPTADGNAWDCGVSQKLLKLVPGYDGKSRLYNGLHYFPVAMRMHDEVYQQMMQPSKQALCATWLGGIAIFTLTTRSPPRAPFKQVGQLLNRS
jgi:hypothetical protein